MPVIRSSLASILFGLQGFIFSACSAASEPPLPPKQGIVFKETLSMKDVSGECAYGIFLAIKNFNDYAKIHGEKSHIGNNLYVKGAFCDLAQNKSSRKFVALLLSDDKEGDNLLLDGQLITYFDDDMNIIEWGR